MPALRIFSSKSLRVIQAAAAAGLGIAANAAPAGIAGKTVFFTQEGQRMAGVVKELGANDSALVSLAVPNADGILLVSDSTISLPLIQLEEFNGVSETRKMTEFSALLNVELGKGVEPKFLTVPDAEEKGMVEDYLNVTFAGYASTFKETTPTDRDGDYVAPGAFAETLAEFSKNPVMLIDHRNSVMSMAGSYSKISTDRRGLAVEGRVSNAPGLRDVRFLLAEGHLKTLSIGGFMYYAQDGRGIERVQLFEISLVAVPANPDAIFTTRALTAPVAAKAYKALAANKGLTFKTK